MATKKEETKVIKTANTTKTEEKAEATPSAADLMAQLVALQKQNAELLGKLAASNQGQNTAQSSGHPDDVTIVWMSESRGVINKVDNLNIVCNRYGEEFVLPRYQFDQLVGMYHGWFDNGTIAVSHKSMDVAAAKGLRTDTEYALKPEILDRLGKMTPAQLTDIWNKTQTDEEKSSIIAHFKRKFMEGKDAGYRDLNRIFALNELSQGALQTEAMEITSKKHKIAPTDLLSNSEDD